MNVSNPSSFAFLPALRKTLQMSFSESIKANQAAFGLSLDDPQIQRLTDYYDLIQQNNQFLHLVAPMTAEEFAIRHILESLTLLEYLPESVRFADVGSGGGLPSIPCILVRNDLQQNMARDVFTGEMDTARIRLDFASQLPDERRFTRSVRADDGVNFAWPHGQAHRIGGEQTPEAFD